MTQIYMGLQEKPPCCWHLFSHVAIFCSLVTNFWPSTVGVNVDDQLCLRLHHNPTPRLRIRRYVSFIISESFKVRSPYPYTLLLYLYILFYELWLMTGIAYLLLMSYYYVVATFTPRSSHISNTRFTHSLLLGSSLPAGRRSAPRDRYIAICYCASICC